MVIPAQPVYINGYHISYGYMVSLGHLEPYIYFDDFLWYFTFKCCNFWFYNHIYFGSIIYVHLNINILIERIW